jgi:two-component system cell cycle sensor histidine kinase/response regulator CckA
MSELPATILVIDDNDAERYYVARVLRKAGFDTVEGASGADALRMARDQPALITLDIRLPDLSGFEVCRRLKADTATRDIPVLHISASFTTPDAKVEGLEGGADGYLTHPVDAAELVATVRSLLRTQHAESRVRAAAREWMATFDLIEDAACLTGADGEIARCNRAFAARLGLPFTDIVGRRLEEVVPELAPLLGDSGTGAVDVQIGDRHFRVSSGAAPLEGSVAPARAWIMGDVTERRRTEETLRESEERAQARLREIETIYDAAPMGLCVLDRDLRFVRINGKLAAMNGVPVAAHLGRTVGEVLPALAATVEPRLRDVLETGEPVTGLEIRGETPAEPGVERVWLEHWYPLRSGDGRVIGINIAAEEVTEQRRAQEQLQQAQRLEAVGRLAGGVAHETNNQMTVVLGCANFVLRNGALPQDVRGDLEQIRQAAERTAAITAQLLAFGRRQLSRPEVTDLNAAIRRLQPILERTVGPLSVIDLELAPGLPTVTVDPGQLDQVLLNLVLNARDAMETGGALTIRTSSARVTGPGAERFVGDEIAPGHYVRVSVSDTGLGMDETVQRRAFEPFFTTKGVGQGTGLGLSMVYGIVKQSGGYISVASQVGRGTTFAFYLPETGAPAAQPGGSSASTAPLPERTILLVEDDASVRSIISRELAGHGYRVLEAANGREAIQRVREFQGKLDAVVTDIQMPELDGRALVDALAELRPGLAVLLMSGHPDDQLVQRLTSSGLPFIQKPFTGEELANQVERALAGN